MQTATSQPDRAGSQSCTDASSDGLEVRIVEQVVEINPGAGTRVLIARHSDGNGLCLHSRPDALTLSVPPGVLDNEQLIDGSAPRLTGLPGSGIKVSALPDKRSKSGWMVKLELGEGMHFMLYTHDQLVVEATASSHGEVKRVAVWLPHETFTCEQDG